jgi:ATP-dependent Lon protease
MRESVEAAHSWLRSHASERGIDAALFEENDLHVHVPSGAIPKDGPSAGVAMVAAMASLLSGIPAHPRVAMTGEITLRGKVLPVGGIKEKVLAAKRAGIEQIVLPAKNEKDVEEIPQKLLEGLDLRYVGDVDEALAYVLAAPS